MAGKQYEVILPFDWVNKKTGDVTSYKVGDDYAGPNVEKYLKGDVNKGPLIREKAASPTDSSKEK